MGKYIINIEHEDMIVNGHLMIPFEVCVQGNDERLKINCKLTNDLTPYTEPDLDAIRKEEYSKGFQAGSANTSLVITDNTIRERIEEAYQRGYDDAKHECQDCQKIMMDAEQERVDKAYQQGVNDAENRRATCEFCEYAGNDESNEPCVRCCCGYINMFRPRKDNNPIYKSIKDIMNPLDCTISDFEKAIEEIKNEAD